MDITDHRIFYISSHVVFFESDSEQHLWRYCVWQGLRDEGKTIKLLQFFWVRNQWKGFWVSDRF
jgi:hypothetical protein